MMKILQASKSVQVSCQYRMSVRQQVRVVELTESQKRKPVEPFARLTDTPKRTFQGWRCP